MGACSAELFLRPFTHPSIHSTDINPRSPILYQTQYWGTGEVRENKTDRISAYHPARETEASEYKRMNVTEWGSQSAKGAESRDPP